jgi:hypothetical protein
VEQLRRVRPGRLGYINLFPNYATPGQLGTANYEEHVERFVAEVRPDVLSMDHYPLFRPDADGRDNYCRNLEVMRRASLQAGIPFWNFFNAMPFGPHSDPTEAQMRWQIHASIAHGAKGVMYFCYWTPRGHEFPKGGAILTPDGRRTRHYEEAKRLNAVLKNLGPVLMQLTSESVQRVQVGTGAAKGAAKGEGARGGGTKHGGTEVGQDLAPGGALRSLSEGDYLVGQFRHRDGRRAVFLQNHHFAYSAWPTAEFAVEAGQVMEVSGRTGRVEPVADDSPDLPGLQLSLDAGEGRLFLLPP